MKILLFLFLFQSSFALDSLLPIGAKVISASSSGNSLVIDKGEVRGLRVGDMAHISLTLGSLEVPRIRILGLAELIRLDEEKSYWIFRDKKSNYKLVSGTQISLQRPSDLLSGREKLSVRSKRVINDPNLDGQEIATIEKEGVPSDVMEHGDDYFEEVATLRENDVTDKDLTSLTDVDMKKRGKVAVSGNVVERLHVPEQESLGEGQGVREGVNKIRAESMVQSRATKTNELQKGINQLYYEQMSSDPKDPHSVSDSFINVFEEYKRSQKDKARVNPAYAAKLKKEGALWSAGLNDNQLRDYLIKTGVAKERLKQDFALGHKLSHELDLSIGTALINQSTTEDQNHQNPGYSLALSYEYHLARTSLSLSAWSFELGLERGVANIDLGGVNGRFVYGNFFGGANWYPFAPPTSLNKLIFYIGGGMKRGNASVTSVELSSEYSYQQLTLPSLWAGLKYRFDSPNDYDVDSPVGIGINVRLTSETTQWSIVENPQDDIESTRSVNDIKLNVAMSVYF